MSRQHQERIILDVIYNHPHRFPELFQGKSKKRRIKKPTFGVKVADFSKISPVSSSIPPIGAYIGSINPNSPAERASLKQGDVILEANGKLITSALDLEKVVKSLKKGSLLTLHVQRQNNRFNTAVLL